MTIDRLINLFVIATLIEMMAAIGLRVKFREVGDIARNWNLLVRAVLANYVCVPVITVGLLLWFRSAPMVAAGFLIIAVCPGAAYGPPLTAIARGNVAVAVGLMVVLAGSSAVLAPLLLQFLMPLMAADQALKVNGPKIVGTLLVSQLLPLSAGLCVRQWRPALADRLKHPAQRLSAALNLCVVGLILVVHFRTLAAIRPIGFAGMLALVSASLAAGWLLGEPGGDNRKAMGFSTSVRNVAVGLVIATASFPESPAVTAALAYGLFQTAVLALVALAWSRLETTAGLAVVKPWYRRSETIACPRSRVAIRGRG